MPPSTRRAAGGRNTFPLVPKGQLPADKLVGRGGMGSVTSRTQMKGAGPVSVVQLGYADIWSAETPHSGNHPLTPYLFGRGTNWRANQRLDYGSKTDS